MAERQEQREARDRVADHRRRDARGHQDHEPAREADDQRDRGVEQAASGARGPDRARVDDGRRDDPHPVRHPQAEQQPEDDAAEEELVEVGRADAAEHAARVALGHREAQAAAAHPRDAEREKRAARP